jgi:hypothetical protein
LVWFDGAPLAGPDGQQARTAFRAYRIAPGHHVLEIKDEPRFRPWKEEVEVEAGSIKKVLATLIPAPAVGRASPSAGGRETTRTARTGTRSESAAESANGDVNRRRVITKKKEISDNPLDGLVDELAAPETAAREFCSITIGSRPWSEVWIDGKKTGKQTPFVDYKVACGRHVLTFKRPDLQIDHKEEITVHAGQKFKQSFTLEDDKL